MYKLTITVSDQTDKVAKLIIPRITKLTGRGGGDTVLDKCGVGIAYFYEITPVLLCIVHLHI